MRCNVFIGPFFRFPFRMASETDIKSNWSSSTCLVVLVAFLVFLVSTSCRNKRQQQDFSEKV